ncbi:MAG: hypothetical protein P8Q90_06980, partial [Candidatus Thalassarchaeaceae archaeon]|nr:hypothetical protein [Candidatus Thalassarchaeaceae archaeon]
VDNEQSKHDMIHSFIQISGRIVAFVSELHEDLISDIAQIAVDENISSLKLRCSLDPEIQPKLQSRVDREMRSLSENNSTSSGFIAEVNNGYVICKEYN